MIQKLLKPYQNLSKEIWILSFITLINRTGAMVVPFLSLYLTKSLNFSLIDVGYIMTFYGFGSLFGTYIGGKLTDKIGYYKVMYVSLIIGGFLFFVIQFLESFWQFSIGLFVLITVIDIFRPAMWIAIQDYSTDENKTRSVTLIRLAINLGFSVGPALAGLIIAVLGYKALFWVDGFSTLIAGILFYVYLFQKTTLKVKSNKEKAQQLSPYRDVQFLLFWFAIFLMGFSFVQIIEILPLFYHDVIQLDEQIIGLLWALNGGLIFLTEMPIVESIDKKFNHIKIIAFGLVLFALSFIILNTYHTLWVAIIGMLLLTFGEVFSFPFSNTYALERSKKGNQGSYMALYGMTFSVAFILGPNIGMYVVAKFGYNTLWYSMVGVLMLSFVILQLLKKNINQNTKNNN